MQFELVTFTVSGISQTDAFNLTATDNPLVDGESGIVYHGGNFQVS
jgi:histidine ammonia-lyase